MTHKDWFEQFIEHRNPVFTKKDFENYKKALEEDLQYYEKYLSKDCRILELGCGLGFKAVPLSSLGYKVVGVDNDKRVVEAARKNAENFGGEIEIIEGDIVKIDQIFQKNSFDVCFTAGVLEHFEAKDVRKILDLQLQLAPVVIAIMPLHVHARHNEPSTGSWSQEEVVSRILKGYNIVEHFVRFRGAGEKRLRLLYLFIKRKE